MYAIGIDIGGMSIKLGLVNEQGEIICQSRFKTATTVNENVNSMVEHVKNLIEQAKLSQKDILGIGIGCPGAVTSETGVVAYLPNLNWENVPLAKMLNEHFDMPIKISNDANVATLGEVIYGCAKNYSTVVMFTLGTGVGGGIVIDKKLFEGGFSRGAELGHFTLILDGEQCSCGRKGCVECYASATALINQTKQAMLEDKDSSMWTFVNGNIDNVDGRTAFECSKTGDKTANKVVDKYVYYLAESMLSVFNIFRPEAFILGGGISAQGDYLINKLKAHCEKFDYGYRDAPRTEILTAKLGNDAGIIGAAALFR
ncbi:MAG: ROK family glucokinase [Clostridiales bacterium]|nr:ROK family glucokinase [Clostridiales bacterium]